jgi:hypothetical protein
LATCSGAVDLAGNKQKSPVVPAPVIAKALGYHGKTTTVVLAEVGGTWNSYPARSGEAVTGGRAGRRTNEEPEGSADLRKLRSTS